MTEQEILQTALEAGFGDARLCRDGEGRPRLLTAYPYLRAKEHGDARISSYYYASQRSYLLLRGLAEKLCAAGLPCRRDDACPSSPWPWPTAWACRGEIPWSSTRASAPRWCSVACCWRRSWKRRSLRPSAAARTAAPANGPARRGAEGVCQGGSDALPADEHAFGKPYPPQLRPLLGDRLLGCDACQEVCPHNKGLEKPAGTASPRSTPSWRGTRPATRG